MTEELLRLEKICCGHDADSLLIKDFSLTLHAGEVLWVVGPRGSGKTTLFEVISKEHPPLSGDGFYLGRALFGKRSYNRTRWRRQIGVIFQDDYLLPDRNVYDNAAFPLQITGASEYKVRELVTRGLSEVSLIGKARHAIDSLSSSDRRLLSLAQVLAKKPPLILADLNSCDVDQQIVAKHLERMASYGCGVLIFSQSRAQSLNQGLTATEVALG